MKHIDFANGMAKAGKLAAQALKYASDMVMEGVTTAEIDKATHDYIVSKGGTPINVGYKGYKHTLCTSVNEVVCHGVPDDTPLKEGDILNIDVAVLLGEYIGDTSKTVSVSSTSLKDINLMAAAENAMMAGIAMIYPNGTTGDIGFVIEQIAKSNNLDVVKECTGHGVGKKYHMEPNILSYGIPGTGALLRPWTCITVEPILIQKGSAISWSRIPESQIIVGKCDNGKRSAQFEHTVLITNSGYEILTKID
jgi:methionyl aminopeptidase